MERVGFIVQDKMISQAVISRLPRYFRYLGELKNEGIERISSQELSARMQVTASQIRQDFNHFGGFGQQGYGYNVNYLYSEIANILGLNEEHNLISIGAGHLGQALVRGFIFRGIFDNNPALWGTTIRGIEVMPMDRIEQFVRENAVDIAVLSIPKDGAVSVANDLVRFGIKAIWNFAHVDLLLPKEVKVENVHLSDSLMKLSYMLASD